MAAEQKKEKDRLRNLSLPLNQLTKSNFMKNP